MIAAAARQLVPPSSVCPHQPQHVGSSTKTLLASSEAHLPQWNCLRRLGDPNSVGSGSATVSAAFSIKVGASPAVDRLEIAPGMSEIFMIFCAYLEAFLNCF